MQGVRKRTSEAKADGVRMRFVSFEEVTERLRDRTVAIVGSAPSCLENEPGFIDSHDVVLRINNYKTGPHSGYRCDVFYSYFGHAITKTVEDLQRDGVSLCMCKCPNAKPIECEWHDRTGKQAGIDFRWIYMMRREWWFCDTFIPTVPAFLEHFDLLDRHIPTTGFSAVLAVLEARPKLLTMTGFDFFTSGIHNVTEKHRPGNPADPIGHRPELEAAWIARNADRYPLAFDATLQKMIQERVSTPMKRYWIQSGELDWSGYADDEIDAFRRAFAAGKDCYLGDFIRIRKSSERGYRYGLTSKALEAAA